MDDPEVRSSRIAWSWVIEVLATHGEVKLQLLWDLIQSIPKLSDNLNEDPREVIALRNLESLFDPAMVSNSGIPSSSDQEEIQFDSSESFSHVLKHLMDQPSMSNLRKNGENPLPNVRKCSSDKLLREVHAYIEEKKTSMPIGALQELSDILQRIDACHETDLERERSCLKTQELMQDDTVEAQSGELPPKKKLIDDNNGSIASAVQNTSPLIPSDMQELSDIRQNGDACHETDLEREMSCLKTQELMQSNRVEAQSDKSTPKRKLIYDDTGSIASAEQSTSPLISSDKKDCPIDDQSDKLLPRKRRRHDSSGSDPCTKLKLAPSTLHDMQDFPVDDQSDKLLSVKKRRDNDNNGSVPCTELKLAPSILSDMQDCPVDAQCGLSPPGKKLRHDSKGSSFSEKNCPADGQTEKNQSHDNSGFIASTEKNSDHSISYDINQPNPPSPKPAHPVSQLEERKNAENSLTPAVVTELGICIKCYKGGDVLICRGSSCPVVVHEWCLGITESIENRDNFLCPFCVCSVAKSKYAEAKERMLVARDKLTLFIGGNTDNQPKKNTKVNANPPRQGSSSKLAEGITSNNCQDNRQFTNVNPSSSRKSRLNQAAQAPTDNQNEVCLAQENNEHTSPSKSIPANSCQTEKRFLLVNAYPPTNQQQNDHLAPDNVHNSTDEKGIGVHQASTNEEHNGNSSPNCSLKEGEDGTAKNSQLEKGDKTIPIEDFYYAGGSSGIRTRQQLDRLTKNGSPGSKSHTAKISDNFSSPKLQRKLADLQGASTGSLDDFDLIAEGETSGANASRSPQRFKKVGRKSYRPNRVPWTDEEVEMLKEGVKRYGSGDVGVMPWSVILEFGSSVFWKGRTGVSLKDKWRNLLKANPGLR